MKMDFTGSEMSSQDAMLLGDEYFLSLTEQKAKPDLLSTAAAAWKIFNPLSSTVEDMQLKSAYGGAEGFTDQPGYNVYDTLEEQYWNEPEMFQTVTSPEEAAYVKSSIDSQYRNREILDDAGGAGIAMMMAAGTLDPVLAPLSLMGGMGVGALTGAMRGAAIATTEMALQETVLHGTQITRTWQESMYAVGAAPLFGGLLGSIGGAMSKAQINKVIKDITGDLKENAVNGGIRAEGGDSVGAASKVGTLAEEQPIGKQGPALSPQMRLLKSLSPNFVNFLNRLSRHDLQIGKNMKTIDVPEARITNADGSVTVEPAHTRIEYSETAPPMEVKLVRELHQVALATQLHVGLAFKGYIGSATKTLARLRGRVQKGTLNLPQFRREVGKAMRKGDAHENPHVQKAAQEIRKTLDNSLERQVAAGMLPDDVKPKYALSYLSRTYDTKYIQNNRSEWYDILESHYINTKGMDVLEAKQAAQDVTNKIMVHGVNPKSVAPSAGKPTKSRTLDIDDAVLEPFLLNDVEKVMDTYMRQTMPHLHWNEQFGTTDIADIIQKGKDDYAKLIAKAREGKKPEKVIAKLEAQLQRDLTDISNARDMYLGQFNLPEGLAQKITNASRAIRGLTVTSNLGSMTLAAIPDVSMQVFKSGLFNTAVGFGQFVSSVGKRAGSREAIREAGNGAEMALASRILSMSELQDLPPVGVAIMKSFGNISLMSPWNTMQKTVAAFATQNRIIKTLKNYEGARPMRKSILAGQGIGDNTAKAMLKQIDEHATKHAGGWIPNTAKWTDRNLADKFDDVIFGVTESTIVTPGVLDKPTAMSYETGKILLQFKSFMFAAHHQIMLPLMQRLPQGDLAALNGLVITGSLGMFSEWSRMYTSGRMQEIENYTAEDWARAAVDRSGWAALPMDGINIVDRVTGGRMTRQLGLKEGSKYFYRNKSDLLTGPAGTTVLGAMNYLGNLTKEDNMTSSDIHGVRRILPYQNLFYTRWLFNQIEESLQQGRTQNRRVR